ncbi:hypothetical protein GGR53DRAFT_517186 [Hypoxylon sp. FL1150]|nr:hypothetical protein GGR53DRAFT_517186 [Hypoxylon sp. FL1150]
MASGSAALSDELARENTMYLIDSDVSQPHLHASPRESLSYQMKQQNSTMDWKAQEPAKLPPTSQLAVHIRSPGSPSHAQQGKHIMRGDMRLRPSPTPVKKEEFVPLSFMQDELEGPSIQPKKRGRPKGWKRGMSYADAKEDVHGDAHGGAEGQTKSNEPKGPADNSREPKRRGRPPRPAAASVRERYLRSNPDYTPFLCDWKFSADKPCPAELQNMKTLRKHVYVVHGDADLLVCRWGKCAARDTPIEFAEQAEFEEHMEREHFRSYVWYTGEGYQNDGISRLERDADKLPAYLFDEHGNQVTPSVAGQEFEDDRQYKERKRKLRRLLIQKDENAPSEEEWTKQTLGIA